MDKLIITELKRSVNPLTGDTNILIRISVPPPHQIEICTGDSQYTLTRAIRLTLIQKNDQNTDNH